MTIMGRPPKEPEERKSRVLLIRISEDEGHVLDAAATKEGKKTSTWARKILLAEAKKKE